MPAETWMKLYVEYKYLNPQKRTFRVSKRNGKVAAERNMMNEKRKVRKTKSVSGVAKLIDSKRPIRKTTQETLNYNKIYPNGVCHVGQKTYNRMIRFSDISYQLSQDEIKQRIFAQYSTLLNSFDDTIKIQFCFINYRMNSEENEEVLAYSKRMSNIEDFETMQEEYFSF